MALRPVERVDWGAAAANSAGDYRAFVEPRLSPSTLDTFFIRRAVLGALRSVLPRFRGSVLDVGCGDAPYKDLILRPPSLATQYVGLDLCDSAYQPPDLCWDGYTIPLGAASVDCAMMTEVLEHCPQPETVLTETARVLAPSGMLFFTIPFLWPLHDVPHDEFRFTPFALRRLLANAGFSEIELVAMGGWDASLAQMIGLWVRRRPMSPRKRAALSVLALPAIRCLLKRDRPRAQFYEGSMIPGLSGTATKPLP